MRLVFSVSGIAVCQMDINKTTDFGHDAKRNQEVGDSHRAAHFHEWVLPRFRCYIDIIGVKLIEEFKILFEAFADIGMNDGRVKGAFPGLGTRADIVIQIVCGGDAKFDGQYNPFKVR